jgi:RNA polymerase sigma-70 factor (ECF subfamily)
MGRPQTTAVEHLEAARAGSAAALGQMLQACRGYLLAIARQELAPDLQAKGGASDLVQETFLEAQRDFARFEGSTEEELLAWLRQLLLHNLANFTRRYRETEKRQIDKEVPLEGPGSSAELGEGLIADTPTPSEVAMRQEREEAVRRALGRLPEEYRQILLWRYQEQLPFEEIGRRLDRTANAARKLWARAVERMQAELETPP